MPKTLIDYFLPTPIHTSLTKDVWGAPGVIPRDTQNGLEDTTMKQWNYWDGQIIKAPDGKYHMFSSRWPESNGHGGWGNSKAIQSVSDNLTGPYVDKGLLWPDDMGGKGHNVTALVMPDGTYAVIISETRPGEVYTSKSLDGPFTHLGTIKFDQNGFPGGRQSSNITMMVRPDGDYEMIARPGQILISKDGILGPFKAQGPNIFPSIPGLPRRNLEDPVIWYSGNCWSERKAYQLTSIDGITNWTNRGLAYDPTNDFIRYTDGTVNRWNNLERPGVYIENGHVVAFTLACIDVPKNADTGDSGHGSKIIIIPFDGAAMDRDLQNAVSATQPAAMPTQVK
jgi:hypothetical protein